MKSRSFLSSGNVRRAFTLVEVVVAVGITAVLASFIVAVLTNVSGFWSRTSGKLSAEAQARYVLDQLTLDLQSAWYRDDGNAWLAATIPANANNTGFWNTTGTTGSAIKPANGAGSLRNIATLNLADARFGIAGTWLRFFTTKRGSNPTPGSVALTNMSTSAPVAVAYQIVRRATTATTANQDRRYLLHRVEVTPAATLAAGYDLLSTASYAPTQNSPAATMGSAREIRYPTIGSVIAENVIDLGVRMYVHAPNQNTGILELTQVFPASNSDLTHVARLPARTPDANGGFSESFPEVIDVMVRVLTDEGARLLAGYEASPQRVQAPPGRSPQDYWWELATSNSQVFTRRIVLPAKPL